ncbi:MAG: tetratricopeptide repeat protein [bacterium]|nr:tetratricopeptide repeat protein [bacterium]
MMRVLAVFLLISAACAPTFADSAFDAGVAAYQNSQWDVAIQSWEAITARNETSGPLEFNLGNAYFRKGDVPRAILHYERARRLIPRDADVQQNLVLANRAIIDQILPQVRLEIWNYFDGLRDTLSPRFLLWLVIIINLLLVVILGLYRFGRIGYQKLLRQTAVGAACALCVMSGWYVWQSVSLSGVHAIVMTEKTDVYSSPAETSTQLFSLHEGTKVKLGEALAEWIEIELADGRKGWMPKQDVEQI